MNLERPGDRIWPKRMLVIAVLISMLVIIFNNELGKFTSWVCNFIAWTLDTVGATAMVISSRDDKLFDRVGQESRTIDLRKVDSQWKAADPELEKKRRRREVYAEISRLKRNQRLGITDFELSEKRKENTK